MKKYAVVGSHGVGKSTFCKKLIEKCIEDFGQKKHIHSISEVVRDCPFPINDKSSVEGCHWIVTRQISYELEAQADGADILICDRCAFDPLVYIISSNKFSLSSFNDLYNLARNWLSTYEKIIFIEADWNDPICDDGFRDTDKKFQMIVNDKFISYLKFYEKEYAKEIIFTSTEELSDKDKLNSLYEKIFWQID